MMCIVAAATICGSPRHVDGGRIIMDCVFRRRPADIDWLRHVAGVVCEDLLLEEV